METKAKLKVEAKVKDTDLATDNFLVGGWGEGKGNAADEGKAVGGCKSGRTMTWRLTISWWEGGVTVSDTHLTLPTINPV